MCIASPSRGVFRKSVAGDFLATPPSGENHGQVHAQGFHFAYDDGTRFSPVGTTAYAWALQNPALQRRTLQTLGNGCFNKLRFCVLPKHYLYNLHEPISYPYEGTPCVIDPKTADFSGIAGVQPGNDWDFERFNPRHFENIERAVLALMRIGVEADLILLHPYDCWGLFADDARAGRLVHPLYGGPAVRVPERWWSLANEYDLLGAKTGQDWERIADLILRHDPYNHLRSIHNCCPMYDYSRPWITHCSIQRTDVYKCAEWTDEFRIRYGKPVVLDEIAYEGDIDQGWGNISGRELTRRFWECCLRGGYATHGETYDRPDGILWWSHGGELHGESPDRIRFLRGILEETPGPGFIRAPGAWDELVATVDRFGDGRYYLYYYGNSRRSRRTFRMPEDQSYRAEVIDTWAMTIRDAGTHNGTFTINLPRKEYMAVRLRRV